MLIGFRSKRRRETRVAVTPETAKKLKAQGHALRIQSGPASWRASPTRLTRRSAPRSPMQPTPSPAISCSSPFAAGQRIAVMKTGAAVVGMLNPFDRDNLHRLAGAGLTSFALEAAPRTTRAQSMDVLSSQATSQATRRDDGRRQVPALLPDADDRGGHRQGGARGGPGRRRGGPAGHRDGQAAGRRHRASDVRPSVKEQVESLGAKFIDVSYTRPRKRKPRKAWAATPSPCRKAGWTGRNRVAKRVARQTSSSRPRDSGTPGSGARDRKMVKAMKPGSVIVDLAAIQGGNCR